MRSSTLVVIQRRTSSEFHGSERSSIEAPDGVGGSTGLGAVPLR
jgi:hypothetical protein